MSFMLLQTPDPRTLREALPDFTRTTHVFLPINDCRNVNEAEGGTHWSLLLVSIVDGVAFHYDSLPPGNATEAQQVTQKIGILLNRRLRFLNLDDSPIQENSSDCGIFVCLSMRHLLLKRLLTVNSTQKVSMSLAGRKVNAAAGRREMVRIIERFRKKRKKEERSYVYPLFHMLFTLYSFFSPLAVSKSSTPSWHTSTRRKSAFSAKVIFWQFFAFLNEF
jgi:sentrin-specific protease 8